jgi:hypothetical protein
MTTMRNIPEIYMKVYWNKMPLVEIKFWKNVTVTEKYMQNLIFLTYIVLYVLNFQNKTELRILFFF